MCSYIFKDLGLANHVLYIANQIYSKVHVIHMSSYEYTYITTLIMGKQIDRYKCYMYVRICMYLSLLMVKMCLVSYQNWFVIITTAQITVTTKTNWHLSKTVEKSKVVQNLTGVMQE